MSDTQLLESPVLAQPESSRAGLPHMLELRNVRKRYGRFVAVQGLDLEVRRGEIFCVMGLSGSGKSTLVRHINRLLEPTSGEVIVDGEDVMAKTPPELRHLRSRKIGMVFQNFALLPHRTVRDKGVCREPEGRRKGRPQPLISLTKENMPR